MGQMVVAIRRLNKKVIVVMTGKICCLGCILLLASFAAVFVWISGGQTLTLFDIAQNLPEFVVRRGMKSFLTLLLLRT
jgi:hypothetical protein